MAESMENQGQKQPETQRQSQVKRHAKPGQDSAGAPQHIGKILYGSTGIKKTDFKLSEIEKDTWQKQGALSPDDFD